MTAGVRVSEEVGVSDDDGVGVEGVVAVLTPQTVVTIDTEPRPIVASLPPTHSLSKRGYGKPISERKA